MLKLKLQYFGHLMWRVDSLENTLIGGREEKGMIEDDMAGWHHCLDGHEFEQALGVGDGQGTLVCCSPWGHKELGMTEWLNWTDIVPMRSWLVGVCPGIANTVNAFHGLIPFVLFLGNSMGSRQMLQNPGGSLSCSEAPMPRAVPWKTPVRPSKLSWLNATWYPGLDAGLKKLPKF